VVNGYLLDTNVLSEVTRPTPEPSVLAHLVDAEGHAAMAAVTWHELRFGVQRMPASRRRDALHIFVRGLPTRFPVLPYDQRAANWHASERARLESIGRPGPFADAQVAAIAVTNELVLVTRNLRDFIGFPELRVESWWGS
jgi:tRNA(fMet)-specific endonuclease VapC